jgi:hypothetical protein
MNVSHSILVYEICAYYGRCSENELFQDHTVVGHSPSETKSTLLCVVFIVGRINIKWNDT